MDLARKLLTAFAAIILMTAGGGFALAADLMPYPVPSNEPLPPPPPGTTWSGLYIGGNLGAAFDPNDLGIKDLSEEQDLSLQFSNDTKLMGGVQAGYNWQLGSWVVGVEGDFDFAKNLNYLASARGRLGWAAGNWLFYGTGGVAFIDTDSNFVVASTGDGPFRFRNGQTDTGFVVGGGIDYKITSNVSLGAEALYYGFGSDATRLSAGTEPFVLKDEQDFTAVRGRLNYHF